MNHYNRMNRYFLFTLLLTAGCSPAKTLFYSYKVDTFVTDTAGKHFISGSRLISCGDYLVEFKPGQKFSANTFVHDDGSSEVEFSPVYFDTMGVYLLANRQYFELDTFTVNAKLIKKGGLGEKEFGVTMGDGSTLLNYTPPFISVPKDTLVNGIPCWYADVLGNEISPVSDTVNMRIVMVKNKKLTSLLKIYGLTAMNNEYCVVGLCYYHKLRPESYIQEIDSLRPVTASERAICESLIKKAGLPLPK